jgi:heavy metal translocating P-type ATPase
MNVMTLSVLLYTGSVEAEAENVFRWLLLCLSAPAVAMLGYPFVAEAARGLARSGGRRFGMDALIAAGSLTAFFVSAAGTVSGRGHIYYDTATMLLALVTFGRMIEATAKGRAGRLTEDLAAMLPVEAERVEPAGTRRVKASELRAGDLLMVRPGGRFPADGVVMEGASAVIESAFTGESGPRAVGAGDRVLAGTVNEAGPLSVRAQAVGEELLLARVVAMARQAMRRPAPFERLAERAVSIFAPATLALALLAGAAWLAAGEPARAGLAALAVVVVACPCALGIAAPLAASVAIARAASEGVLVSGGETLELAGRARIVFLDKTGTLTAGSPEVVSAEPLDAKIAGDELLAWLAAMESQSEHALGRAVLAEARRRGLDVGTVRDARIFPGRGVRGIAIRGGESREIIAGTEAFVVASGAAMPACAAPPAGRPAALGAGDSGGTSMTDILVAWDGRIRGRVTLADRLRPDSAAAVGELSAMGVRTALLSGDKAESAGEIARRLGVSRVEAPRLPHEKLLCLRAAQASGAPAVMVGDGINDAPALAEAGVGIALGAGTDLARHAGGVVILSNRLTLVPWLLALGRRVRRTIRQNLAWAIGYNAVALAAAAAGALHPLLAAVAMVASSLTVIGNSLRLGAFPSPAYPESGGI